MLDKIKKIFGGYKKSPAVLSFRNKDYDYCVVDTYASYFPSRNKFEYANHLGALDEYDKNTFEINNTKLIVIGHPQKDKFDGLLVTGNKKIKPEFFEKKNGKKYECFFH